MTSLSTAEDARRHTELDHCDDAACELHNAADEQLSDVTMSRNDFADDSDEESDHDSDSDEDDEEYNDQASWYYGDEPDSDENGNDEFDDTELKFLPFNYTTANPQAECPLFQTLPGEIRNHIFRYTLTEYEDKDLPYEDKTPYKRPEFAAPRKIDTALLSTCKRVYQEGWYLPWSTAEHIFFLTSSERRPERVTSVRQMKKACRIVHAVQGKNETASVSVYAQLWCLEGGVSLRNVLNVPHLNPLSVCVTIRHTDWWWWESDTPLKIAAAWVDDCRIPASTQVMRMQLESAMRRKDQIDDIANQMIEKWTFRRDDGIFMKAAKEDVSVRSWTGKSTWEGNRWVRDESRPSEIDYYVKTVVWKPAHPDQTSQTSTIKNPDLQVSFRPAVNKRDGFFEAEMIDRLIGENADRMTGLELEDMLVTRIEEERAKLARQWHLQSCATEQVGAHESGDLTVWKC